MATRSARKILFIKCFRFDEKHFVVAQPLGVMYLSSYLRQQGDYEIKIIDMRLEANRSAETVAGIAREFNPDLLCFSALTIEAPSMYEVLRLLKPALPGVPVVVGGPHSSSAPERCLRDGPVDLAVIGEGEQTLLEIVRRLEDGRDLSEIPGTAWLDEEGQMVKAAPRGAIEDLDSLPLPAYDLIPMQEYYRHWRPSQVGTGPYMSIFTSRACPYKCIYCHDLFGKTFRARSVESVMREIETLQQRYGIREFEILDDIFNFNRQRVRDFCNEIHARRLDIRFTFPNGLRTDILDKELIDQLADAGCMQIAFAVESASERVQKLIRKYNRLDKVRDIINHASARRIFCNGCFMIGFPGETREEMMETLRFAIDSRLHVAGLFIANPFEGTELARIARERGLAMDMTYNRFDYYETDFNMSGVPDQDLRELVKWGLLRFYFKPSRMWRILRDHPNRRLLPGQFLHLVHRSVDPVGRWRRLMKSWRTPSAENVQVPAQA